MKWKTILALLVVYTAVALDWSWPWGILFLMWTIPALYSGQTHLVEEIGRRDHPVLFWLIVGTWMLLSLYLIATDLLRLF